MKRFVFAVLPLMLPAALAAQGSLSVTVFEDHNGNGARDAGERTIPNVVISNQRDVTTTDATGVAHLDRGPTGIVFVSVPNGYRAVGEFWRAPSTSDTQLTFALQAAPAPGSFRFVHASDTHLQQSNVDRFRRFRTLVDSIHPDLMVIAGDLVRDAMSMPQAGAEEYFQLFKSEASQFRTPIHTVPGNHDHYGIIRSRSHADPANPLYNRGMYRKYLGPDYYSFTYGGVHFIGLNTLEPDDSAYYGNVDSLQLAWLARDLEHVSPTMPIVTFMHIPIIGAFYDLNGYFDDMLVGALAHVNGQTTLRHSVGNFREVLSVFKDRRHVLALCAHSHVGERITIETTPEPLRVDVSAAVVGPVEVGPLKLRSGFTLYTVMNGRIDAGTFIGLDPP